MFPCAGSSLLKPMSLNLVNIHPRTDQIVLLNGHSHIYKHFIIALYCRCSYLKESAVLFDSTQVFLCARVWVPIHYWNCFTSLPSVCCFNSKKTYLVQLVDNLDHAKITQHLLWTFFSVPHDLECLQPISSICEEVWDISGCHVTAGCRYFGRKMNSHQTSG